MREHRKAALSVVGRADVPLRQPCARPLYVDMDGTLLATDVLWELFVLLVKTRPVLLLWVPFWLMKGKACLKRHLASRLMLNPKLLPYHEPVLAFLTEEYRDGREIVLATASDRLVAEPVAHYVGLFSEVLASDGNVNLAGATKLSAIVRHADGAPFDYIGNSSADLPIWRRAARAILVRPSRRLRAQAERTATVDRVLGPRPGGWRSVLRTLRVHQWSKNALVLVPLLLAHRIADPARLLDGVLAFIVFSLAASGVYIANDLLDLESDRRHPYKRFRPLAAGAIPIPLAIGLLLVAVPVSLGIAVALLPGLFTGVLLLYLAASTAYSFGLKRIVIVDVLTLAGLYTLRVLAGAVATQVAVSPWFLAFSMFFFVSLAFVKRYAELRLGGDEKGTQDYLLARGYVAGDAELLRSVGPTSGYLAVAVLALYINSPEVLMLYSRPTVLWMLGPLLLYWVTRVWFLAHRGRMQHDPVVWALTDRPSWALAGVVAALLLVASVG